MTIQKCEPGTHTTDDNKRGDNIGGQFTRGMVYCDLSQLKAAVGTPGNIGTVNDYPTTLSNTCTTDTATT